MALKRSLTLLRPLLMPPHPCVAIAQMPVTFTRCNSSTVSKTIVNKANLENECLLKNLTLMGVDLKMARRRQPGVLRKVFTNEEGVAYFLQSKGTSQEVIAGIISRFPRAITRSVDHLEERWQLWRRIFNSDSEIVSILHRSPESFFRSSDNENLKKNIVFLTSLGIDSKELHRLLSTAPRTISNRFELNRQMVELLQSVCMSLGGDDPGKFTKAVMRRNLYILIRSTKRVKQNIEFLQSSLKLDDAALLDLLQGSAAGILDHCHESLKKNFENLQAKLLSLGCHKSDMKRLILNYAEVLFVSPSKLNGKIDILVEGGIKIKQIIEKPRVLDFSASNIAQRLDKLDRVGYDFESNGIAILDTSRIRFEAKLGRLTSEE